MYVRLSSLLSVAVSISARKAAIARKMSIVALDRRTAKLLTTAQVVTSVSTAVKELVENAIDAQASSIEIKLEDNGASLIEVSDNGKGVPESDTPFMALQSYTSKINNLSDLDRLEFYGFRGEALSSLCAVAQVTVTTKTDSDQAARLYRMNPDGSIQSSELSHRSTGTTIQAKNMFKDLPVRRQLITSGRRSIQDVKTLETILRSFGICHPKMRISYRVNGSVIFTKPSTKTIKESLTYLYGNKFVSQIDIVEKISPEVDVHLTIPKKDATELSEVCHCGQRVFINQRYVLYKEIEKAVDRRLVEYFGEKVPAKKKLGFLLSLRVLPSDIDVNLEPNKTLVLLTNKAKILETLDAILVKYYGIVARTEDTPAKEVNTRNDSTAEYRDSSGNQTKISEFWEIPSAKKRKVVDITASRTGRDSSAVKKVATESVAEEKTAKKIRSAKKLFETTAERFNEWNKENRLANLKLEDLPASMVSETMSELPMVDLGDDFSTQEILDLPNLDPKQVEDVLRNDGNQSSRLETAGSIKRKPIVTDEAWSKGQVPIKLQGGTDVHIYKNAADDPMPETGTIVADSNSMACTGFSKFSTEMRPRIIRENPGINFVETAKKLTELWKESSPEERGYYRDLAAADAAQQSNHDTSIGSTKLDSNKKRLLNMLDKMKHTKPGTKRENLMMRTVVPLSVNLETVTKSFLGTKSKVNSKGKSVVVGGLDDNVWLARIGFQLWALNLGQLFRGFNLDRPEKNEITREYIEKLLDRWLQEKEGLSLLHPVFELG